jgi:hypothetical protein
MKVALFLFVKNMAMKYSWGSVVLFHTDTYLIAFIHHEQMQSYKELGNSTIVKFNHMSDDHKLVTQQDEVPVKLALLKG